MRRANSHLACDVRLYIKTGNYVNMNLSIDFNMIELHGYGCSNNTRGEEVQQEPWCQQLAVYRSVVYQWPALIVLVSIYSQGHDRDNHWVATISDLIAVRYLSELLITKQEHVA